LIPKVIVPAFGVKKFCFGKHNYQYLFSCRLRFDMVECKELQLSIIHERKIKRTKILAGIEDTLGKHCK